MDNKSLLISSSFSETFLSKKKRAIGRRKKLKTVVIDYINGKSTAREREDEHTFSWGFSFESPWRQNCNKLILMYIWMFEGVDTRIIFNF